jgi:hypothetical protein
MTVKKANLPGLLKSGDVQHHYPFHRHSRWWASGQVESISIHVPLQLKSEALALSKRYSDAAFHHMQMLLRPADPPGQCLPGEWWHYAVRCLGFSPRLSGWRGLMCVGAPRVLSPYYGEHLS